MNDNDLQLIASLVDGDLAAAEEQEARSLIAGDEELQRAYEEQLAVASLLGSEPAAVMTDMERTGLRAALRTELRLDGAASPPEKSAWWVGWRVPLGGLATVAALLVAFVVVPNLGGGDTAQEALAPAPLTTTAPAAAPQAGSAEDNGSSGADALEESAPSTTALARDYVASGAQRFALAPTEPSLVTLPLVEEDWTGVDGLGSAVDDATGLTSVDINRILACFEASGSSITDVTLVGVDGASVVGIGIDPETGAETVVVIDPATCSVSVP